LLDERSHDPGEAELLPKLSTNRHRMKMLGIAPPDIAKIKEAP
jgi:hypothetical protein